MARVPNKSFQVICELLECIVSYGEILQNPLYPDRLSDSDRYPETHHIVIKSDNERMDAIIKLIFGELDEPRKIGNRSFLDHDKYLMADLKKDMKETGESREVLFEKYIKMADRRSKGTDDDSVRDRLEKAYQALSRDQKSEKFIDYEVDEGRGFESNVTEDEIRCVLFPWLRKYRSELIKLLNE